jgi:hypothetical protein
MKNFTIILFVISLCSSCSEDSQVSEKAPQAPQAQAAPQAPQAQAAPLIPQISISPIEKGLRLHTIETVENYMTRVDPRFGTGFCDIVKNPRIVEYTTGTILSQKIKGRVSKLQTPVPAMNAIVKFKCIEKAQARKTTSHYQVFLGFDMEFESLRCRTISSMGTGPSYRLNYEWNRTEGERVNTTMTTIQNHCEYNPQRNVASQQHLSGLGL